MKKMTEREKFEDHYKTSRDYKFYVKHEMTEKQIFEFDHTKYKVGCVNDAWIVWQAAKKDAVPDGFKVVSFKQISELAVALNKIDLMTHAEQKTNEVRLAWQDVASKLGAMLEAQEQADV